MDSLRLFRKTMVGQGALLLAAPFAFGVADALASPLPGGTLDPLTVPKYVTPLVIPPVMNDSGTPGDYNIAVRQFQQQILPGGIWNSLNGRTDSFPATTVWSYGPAADPTPAVAPDPSSQFNYPAYTIEAKRNVVTTVDWINDLVQNPDACRTSEHPGSDPACNYLSHLLPVDRSLHWANPEQLTCIEPGKTKDCAPDPSNGLILQQPYDGPVPIVTHVHGAHVGPESDGYTEAWWLPAANNIPSSYATTGTLVNQFGVQTNTTPGVGTFTYPNDQPSATIWYHDHTLGMTRSNVYAGPAGFWIIRDPNAPNGGENGLIAGTLPGPAPAAGQAVLDLNVPGNPVRAAIREIPIAIQDRSFNADGSLFYPDNRAFFEGLTPAELQIPFIGDPNNPSDIAPIWNPEAFFNTMVVNGVSWPILEVEPDVYRFRMLNGCNARFLNLSMFVVKADGTLSKTEVPFYQIGAEQSLLPKVVKIATGKRTVLPGTGTQGVTVPAASPETALLMGNAERADVLVDFSNLAPGTRVRMINTAPDAPFGGFPDVPADPSTSGQIMEFMVGADTSVGEGFSRPNQLVLGPVENVDTYPTGVANLNPVPRDQALLEEESLLVCATITPDGTIIYDPNSRPDPAAPGTCVDTVTGTLADSLPFGPKAAVLGVNGSSPTPKVTLWSDPIETNPQYDAAGNPPTETWEFWNHTVDGHPIHVHEVKFKVLSREAFDPATGALVPDTLRQPEATEAGWKDTVISYPGEVTRIAATFDLQGLYVWHCHIVEHEDNEMMVPYCVGNMDPTKGPVAPGCLMPPAVKLYLSLSGSGTLAGLGPNGTDLAYRDADILSWNGINYDLFFASTAAGLAQGASVSAFDVDTANNRILMSFGANTTIPGLGAVTGSDIIAYDLATKQFSLLFRGADVGLTTNPERVDALHLLPDGRLLVSINGDGQVPAAGISIAVRGHDLISFTPTSLGAPTTGTWGFYFDGSDVGLTVPDEGVDSGSVGTDGLVYLSTRGNFAVAGLSGQREDVFTCTPSSLGTNTACSSFALFFDGTANGLSGRNVDGFDLP